MGGSWECRRRVGRKRSPRTGLHLVPCSSCWPRNRQHKWQCWPKSQRSISANHPPVQRKSGAWANEVEAGRSIWPFLFCSMEKSLHLAACSADWPLTRNDSSPADWRTPLLFIPMIFPLFSPLRPDLLFWGPAPVRGRVSSPSDTPSIVSPPSAIQVLRGVITGRKKNRLPRLWCADAFWLKNGRYDARRQLATVAVSTTRLEKSRTTKDIIIGFFRATLRRIMCRRYSIDFSSSSVDCWTRRPETSHFGRHLMIIMIYLLAGPCCRWWRGTRFSRCSTDRSTRIVDGICAFVD